MFNEILFWCEFPEKIKWEKLNHLLKKHNLKVKIGLVCKSKKEFNKYKSHSNIKITKAWPILSKEEGYWFSSQSSKKSIDKLDQYKGMKIKLDIEPPIPLVKSYTKNKSEINKWFLKHIFKKGKNKEYLQNKIKKLSRNTDIMLSTFLFPNFILNRLGMVFNKNLSYNYILYTSFIPQKLKFLYKFYARILIKNKLKFDSNSYIAVGLLSPGIFKDEPCYKSTKDLEQDLDFLNKLNVKNIVIFRLGSLIEEKWIEVIKKFTP